MANNALRHHWLMPISCHFRDCKALLVTSLTHVSGAITSVQIFTFTFTWGIEGARASCAPPLDPPLRLHLFCLVVLLPVAVSGDLGHAVVKWCPTSRRQYGCSSAWLDYTTSAVSKRQTTNGRASSTCQASTVMKAKLTAGTPTRMAQRGCANALSQR